MKQFKRSLCITFVIISLGLSSENVRSNHACISILNDIDGYKIKSYSNGKVNQFTTTVGGALKTAFLVKNPSRNETILQNISFEVIANSDSFPVILYFYTHSDSGPTNYLGNTDTIYFKSKPELIQKLGGIDKHKLQTISLDISKYALKIPIEGLFVVINASNVTFQLSKRGEGWFRPFENKDIWRRGDPHQTLSYKLSLLIKK